MTHGDGWHCDEFALMQVKKIARGKHWFVLILIAIVPLYVLDILFPADSDSKVWLGIIVLALCFSFVIHLLARESVRHYELLKYLNDKIKAMEEKRE